MRKLILVIAFLLLLLVCSLKQVFAVSYTVSIVAERGTVIDGHVLDGMDSTSPFLNDNGDVAFIAGGRPIGGGAGKTGIYTLNSLLVQEGDTIDGITFGGFGPMERGVSLNNNGEVAFYTSHATGGGVFTQNDHVAEVGQTIDGMTIGRIFGLTPINDSGNVAFMANISTGRGIFSKNGLLVKTGQTIAGKTITEDITFSNHSLNNNEVVAFRAAYTNSNNRAIFTHDALLVDTGDIIGGKTITSIGGGVSINDNGDIGFNATFFGGEGIFTQDSLLVETGDTIGGKILTGLEENIDMNNSMDVAFRGEFSTGAGIFTQDALVAQTGQTIDGKMLSGLGNYASINDNGDVAFLGIFSDGSRGVMLGQKTVTEPPPQPYSQTKTAS